MPTELAVNYDHYFLVLAPRGRPHTSPAQRAGFRLAIYGKSPERASHNLCDTRAKWVAPLGLVFSFLFMTQGAAGIAGYALGWYGVAPLGLLMKKRIAIIESRTLQA